MDFAASAETSQCNIFLMYSKNRTFCYTIRLNLHELCTFAKQNTRVVRRFSSYLVFKIRKKANNIYNKY